MNDPRKTQFSGYARAQYERLLPYFKEADKQDILDTLAENAYDLVGYTISHVEPKDLDTLEYEECLHRIPDTPVLPRK